MNTTTLFHSQRASHAPCHRLVGQRLAGQPVHPFGRRFRPVAFLVVLVMGLLAGTVRGYTTWAQAPASTRRADAIVIVNQNSPRYVDFTQYIQPYLNNFGVPYTLVNIASTAVPANIGDYALIIMGHSSMDNDNVLLDTSEQSLISSAVNNGSGFINFDNDLAQSGTPRYQYTQDIFGFGYYSAFSEAVLQINSSATLGKYVIGLQANNASYSFPNATPMLGVTLGANSETLAKLGNNPLLVARQYGQGRAIQWTSYGWMNAYIWGPVHGLDDLVWRSLVWAARKPFVMQGLPNFVAFRVDDSTGPYAWADTAANYGFKVWNGFFINDQDAQDITDMRRLINAGKMTASVHAVTSNDWFFYDHINSAPWSDSVVAQHWALAEAFHANNAIPKSKYVVPHYYEFGANTFQGLQNYGAEFVGTVQAINQTHIGDITLLGGPYCFYQTPCVPGRWPVYYSHFLSVPGHPEFDGKFFNVLTEIRDNAGYEWYPSNDVATTVSRGVTQLTRAFNGMNLATLFTHEYLIQPISSANWNAIMAGVTSGIAGYNPIYVTMDYAAQYVRAMVTSNIATSVYDPNTGNLQTTLSGKTDLVTRFTVYGEQAGAITSATQDVPIFNGSTTVNYNYINPPTPTPSPVPTNGPTPTLVPPSPTPTADPIIRINVDEDIHQSPVLATTTNAADLNASDNAWTEFLYTQRNYAGVFAGVAETPPVMRFYATNLPNGTYTLRANLYWNSNLRYYWGLSAANPRQFSLDVTSGVGGDFFVYTLGTVTVSNGTFEMFVDKADLLTPGGYPFYGWAWLLLEPTSNTPTSTPLPTATATVIGAPTSTATTAPSPTLPPPPTGTPAPTPSDGSLRIDVYEDTHQSPILATTTNVADLIPTDNAWTEFLYTPRNYAGVFAATSETPPTMRFYASVPNGTYTMYANLYRSSDLRYYWGSSAANPQQFSYVVNTGTVGDFSEQNLGTVVVTNGLFEIYVNKADLLTPGGYPFFGWAWIRLVPGGAATITPAPTQTNTAIPPTPTKTNTPAPVTLTPTKTNTPVPPTLTPTKTNTPVPPTATPTKTNTPVPPTATPVPQGSGQIYREWWTGISGVLVTDLTGNANYPNAPSGNNLLTSFEAPSTWADNYGTRIRGYVHAPVTGQYTFWIASDDAGQLLLSTDATPANARSIASVPSWTNSREWTKYAQQQSVAITLQAGQKYYIEALQKEGTGGDNLAVAWRIPGGAQTIIPGAYLSPFNPPPLVSLSAPANGAVINVGTAINLAANASDVNGTVSRVEFYDGATLLNSDTVAPFAFTWSNAAVGAHALTAKAYDNAGASSTSSVVNITVSVPAGTGTGLSGRYFNNLTLDGSPVLQRTEAINFDWSTSSPGTGVTADNFSVRWMGQVDVAATGTYQFQTVSDDGVRLWVNGSLLINDWSDHSANTVTSVAVNLTAGTKYNIMVEYYEHGGSALVRLQWKPFFTSAFAAVPSDRLYALNNLAQGRTVTSSSSAEISGQWSRPYASDGQASSSGRLGWSSDNTRTANHSEWVLIDLGSSYNINQIGLAPRRDGVNAGYGFPIDFNIQVSTNGSTWSTIINRTAYAKPDGTTQLFNFASVAARYVRVNGTSLRQNPNDGNQYRMQFAEIFVGRAP